MSRKASRVLLSLTLKQKFVLTLLAAILTTTPLWPGLERVQSASNTPAINGPAALPPTPVPEVKLAGVPSEALLGEQFKVKVTFDNTGNAVGYGPFIDVLLPSKGKDGTNAFGPCDGISTPAGLDAMMVGVNGGPLPVKTYQAMTTPCGTVNSPVTHPFSGSGLPPVIVPGGDQLVTLELPFGSFEPAQPKVEVEITVNLHNYADAGQKLTIYARGGFRFGATPLNDFSSDPPILTNSGNPLTDGGNPSTSNNWVERKDVTPTVMTITKTYFGPEGEAVSGPNFVDYYPLRYQVSINIADGQKLTNVTLDDCLENNMSFVGLVPGSTTPGYTGLSTSPCLHLSYGTVTGTNLPAEIVVTYEFYITQFIAGTSAPVLDPETCGNKTSKNEATVSGNWTPLDPRDSAMAMTITKSTNYILTDKRLAIQKSVKVMVPGKKKGQLLEKNDLPIPGDYLEYRLKFQVSDYFTFGELTIDDLLSDGQRFIETPPAKPAALRVTDRFGTTQGFFTNGSDLTVEESEKECQGVKGGTRLLFRISKAMMSLSSFPRHNQGIMTGGHAFSPASNTPAEGEIVFYAQVQDEFSYQGDDKKKYVDKHDPLNNCVQIAGRIYHNSDDKEPQPMANNDSVCSDDSSTSLMIKPDMLRKEIIARNGKALQQPQTAPPKYGAGDTITFSVSKTIPSGDWENLTIRDWAPLPALNMSTLSFANSLPSCGASFPAAGQVCLNTSNDNVGTPWTMTLNSDNSFTFDYGTQNNPANTPRTIEIWYSLTLTNEPYADGLFFTNEAQECEFNTFGVKFCQVAVARFELTEPAVKISKGVVWAGSGTPLSKNPSAIFTPGQVGPSGVIFNGPSSGCPSFGGAPITSSGLSINPINSDVSNVDAQDILLFAIVVENKGSGLNGAFDVFVKDTLPLTGFTVVSPVCATYGDGSTLGTSPALSPSLFGPGVMLNNVSSTQGALAPLNATSASNGHNIAVITYFARIDKAITPSCYTNKAELLNYASTEKGPNFVKAGFGGPFSDTASACVLPKAEKCVVATSEQHTQPDNSLALSPPQPPKVTIGEIVRYRLQVQIPEGVSNALFIKDSLPPGMTYMNDNTARVAFISDGGLTSSAPAFANLPLLHMQATKVNCAGPKTQALMPGSQVSISATGPSFNLGTLTNGDNDAPPEYVIVEFNALVNNIPANVDGVTLTNSYDVLIKGAANPVATASTPVKIVEPKLDITKTAAPASVQPGGIVTFNVKVTNNGTADAFDVSITDPLPASSGLSIIPGTISVLPTSCDTPTLNTSTGTVSLPHIPVGCSVTMTFQAKVIVKCPTASVINTAYTTYSSLPLNGTPLGPNNQTGSLTPGASGAVNGERQYKSSGSVTVPLICTGSLTVTKTITSQPPFTPPSGTVFPVNVACAPSGLNVTLNLTAGSPTQTVNNIPVGNTCTVTEGTLPPPISTPVCASLGWGTPTYAPGQSVAIQTAGSNTTVLVQNTYMCKTQQSCAKPPVGMVSWWPLNETTGNTVVDIMGGHNGATSANIGGDPLSASSPKVGNALLFLNSRATVAGGPYNFGSGNFSIDAWVRGPTGNAALGIVDKLDTSTPVPTGFAFYIRSNKLQLTMGNGNASAQTFTSPATFTYGVWQHVAVTVQRVGIGAPIGRFYLNGAQVGTFIPPMTSVNNNASLLLGNYHLNVGCSSCEVSLDEIEIFNSAVNASDILAIFNAGSVGKCRAVISGLKFSDENGNGSLDTSSGEYGLPGWTIKLTDSSGNSQTAVTNSTGNYSFTVPAPGSYTVSEIQQAGWTQTAPAGAGTYSVNVAANQSISNRNFGNRKGVSQSKQVRAKEKSFPRLN